MTDVPSMSELDARRAIAAAVNSLEIATTEAWTSLEPLSSQTHVDQLEVFEDEIRLRKERFEGLVNVHCTLDYGDGDDGFTLSETFPGRFEGMMTEGGPTISRLVVDVASFYS